MNRIYPKGLYLLAIVLILSAVGVIKFWVDWFVGSHYATALPEHYRVFENTFPLPDLIMAILMFITAGELFFKSEKALLYGYFVSGMLLYLASLDTLYHLQHGNFSDWGDPETPQRVFISVHCYTLGVVTLVYLWYRRGAFMSAPAAIKTPGLIVYFAFILLAYAVSRVFFWGTWVLIQSEYPEVARVFYNAFFLADTVSVVLCVAAAAGIFLRKYVIVLPAGIAGLAGVTFGTLSFAGFTYMNPELIAPATRAIWELQVEHLVLGIGGAWMFWRYRGMLA